MDLVEEKQEAGLLLNADDARELILMFSSYEANILPLLTSDLVNPISSAAASRGVRDV
jgi:hypothetical protein